MINNLRDAEIKIERLERELSYMKKIVRSMGGEFPIDPLATAGISPLSASHNAQTLAAPNQRANQQVIDSKKQRNGSIDLSKDSTYDQGSVHHALDEDVNISSDGSTVYHRLKHIFRDITLPAGIIPDPIPPEQDIHFDSIYVGAPGAVNEWLQTAYPVGSVLNPSLGAGRLFTMLSPSSTTAYGIHENGSGVTTILMYSDIIPGGNMLRNLGSTANRFNNIYSAALDTAMVQSYNYSVYDSQTSQFKPGVGQETDIVYEVFYNLTAIYYKDHNNINQTSYFVSSTTPKVKHYKWIAGILTSAATIS